MSQKITPGRLRTMMCAMDTCTLHRTRITVLLREPSPLFLSRHMEDLQVWHDLIVSLIASYNVIFSPYYITCTSTYLPNFFISKHHQTLRSELVLFINKKFGRKEMLSVDFFNFVCVCVCYWDFWRVLQKSRNWL